MCGGHSDDGEPTDGRVGEPVRRTMNATDASEQTRMVTKKLSQCAQEQAREVLSENQCVRTHAPPSGTTDDVRGKKAARTTKNAMAKHVQSSSSRAVTKLGSLINIILSSSGRSLRFSRTSRRITSLCAKYYNYIIIIITNNNYYCTSQRR